MSEENKKEYNIDQMFEDSRKHQSGHNLVVGIYGPPESGKTYLAMDFPGPLKIVNLDYGINENIKFFPDKEIQDFKPLDFEDIKLDVNDDKKWDKVNPEKSLKKFEAGLSHLIKNQHGGTVIIDSMTTVNEWLKLLLDYKTDEEGKQNDGKIAMFDWKYVNSKWKWLWQFIKSVDANVVVIFRSKEVYEDFKPTGKFVADYREGTRYEVSVEIEMNKVVDQDASGKVITKRISKFNKFRGVNLSQNYVEEDLTYKRLLEILQKEGKA